MSTTVQQIYTAVTDVMLEPGGFVLGIFSEAQFLHALAAVLLDFTQRTGITKLIYTQQIVAGASEYTVPERIMAPEMCFVAGRLIEKVAEADLTQGRLEWKARTGPPEQWHEDNLTVKRVQVTPTPDYSGTVDAGTYGDFLPAERNLTIVGPAAPSQTVWALTDTLDTIPDAFAHYLVYGVLEQIFNAEGETKDNQRALYCHTRWQEAIALASAIAREALGEEGE